MAKIPCQYCGQIMHDFLMNMHEKNCPKKPADNVPLPPAVEYIPAPPPAPVIKSENERALDIMAEAARREGERSTAALHDFIEKNQQASSVSPANNGLFAPQSNPYFVIPRDLGDKMGREIVASQTLSWPRNVRNILFTGPRGAGKTSLGLQIAARLSRDGKYPGSGKCYIAPCSTMQEPAQWWGTQQVSPERGTYYIESGFVRACETPGCVIILDDMNRTENPKVLNALFLILDNDIREAQIDDIGRKLRVADGVIFVATINEGFEYQGTDPMDLALRDRFDQIGIDYPPGDQIQEILQRRTGVIFETAERLGRFARTLADHPNPDERIFLSMRQMISIAEDVVLGGSIRDAVLFSISAGMTTEQIEKVSAILQTILEDNYMGRVPDWRPWQ